MKNTSHQQEVCSQFIFTILHVSPASLQHKGKNVIKEHSGREGSHLPTLRFSVQWGLRLLFYMRQDWGEKTNTLEYTLLKNFLQPQIAVLFWVLFLFVSLT